MSKKQEKITEKVISENLPTEERWLMQPTNITFLRGDITPKQWGMMIELMDALQCKIADALTTKSTSIFADDDYDAENKVYVQVPLRAITDNPQYYRYVEEVASSFFDLKFAVDKTNKDGSTYTELSHAIHKVRIPKESTGPDVKQYRKGYVEFVLLREEAETLFSLAPNNISNSPYHKYIKSVAKNAKSFYTSRIYVFLTAYRKFGRWTPLYSELHKILGFSQYNSTTHEWEVKKYPNYRQFKQKVLKGAQDELRELANKGEVDCYFDFEEIYPIGVHRGSPEKIRFTIHTTDYGQQHDTDTRQNKILIDIEDVLRNDFECTTSDVKQILGLVDADNAEYCIEQMSVIKAYIENNKDKIGNVKAYAVSSIKNALMQLVPVVEEVGVPKSADVEDAMSREQSGVEVSDSDKEKWSRVVEMLNGSPAIEAMKLSADDKGIYIEVPTKALVETFKDVMNIVRENGYRIKVPT